MSYLNQLTILLILFSMRSGWIYADEDSIPKTGLSLADAQAQSILMVQNGFGISIISEPTMPP